MNRQKSFENDKPTLYLVPTPIGNLSEMSPRAIEILKSVPVIACEDTRTSGQLLKHFDIHARLIAYQNFNEESSSKGIVNLLDQGMSVALISDAGYPLVSDPGQTVVSLAVASGYNVVPVSGPSALLNGLVASGLIVEPFLFAGFLPAGQNERRKMLRYYRNYPMTLVFYEAPHRIEKMLTDAYEIFGDRQACLARELTKMHEEFLRGTLGELVHACQDLRGEMVVVIAGSREDPAPDIDYSHLLDQVQQAIAAGMSARDAVRSIAAANGISKNDLYEHYLKKEGRA